MEISPTAAPRVARWRSLLAWIDNRAFVLPGDDAQPIAGWASIDWLRVVPFIAMHLACLAVLWVGTSPTAVGLAVAAYLVRMFAITGFYHRYFSHRAFKTSRPIQFAFALLGATAGQRGPLWWASHHRHHHVNADQPDDAHSVRQHGLLWAHTGWFLSPQNFPAKTHYVRDLARFPELRWIDRFDTFVTVAFGAAMWLLGALLQAHAPGLGITGAQAFVWGFCISTVALYHGTFTINSLAHSFGSRRYQTDDDSRNNGWLALLTLGEGWHNNHHHFPGSARQGFFWWEIDPTFYLLKALALVGLISELREVPPAMRSAGGRAARSAQ